MTDLVKSYASWLLKKYSSVISVPKEINDLSKAQKVWLILTFVSTLAAWTILLISPFLLAINPDPDDTFPILILVTFWATVGLILPLVIYWLIESIYKLISWVTD